MTLVRQLDQPDDISWLLRPLPLAARSLAKPGTGSRKTTYSFRLGSNPPLKVQSVELGIQSAPVVFRLLAPIWELSGDMPSFSRSSCGSSPNLVNVP